MIRSTPCGRHPRRTSRSGDKIIIINLSSICHSLLTRSKSPVSDFTWRTPVHPVSGARDARPFATRPSFRTFRTIIMIAHQERNRSRGPVALAMTTFLIVRATGEHARRPDGQSRDRRSLHTAATRLCLFRWRRPSEETRVAAPTHIPVQWRV